MRTFFLSILFAGALSAQTVPTIGVVDFYGLRKVPEARIRQALGAKEGDKLPPSKGDVEERLDAVPGVVEGHLEAVCCNDGKTILYVGIEEKGSPHFELRDPPDAEIALPEEVTAAYRRFMEAFSAAVRRGETEEDLTQGHSRMRDQNSRAVQDMFPGLAARHLEELRNVLRNSGDEDQRATAAYIIAYLDDKKEVIDDVQFALKDSDARVRQNAAHALMAMAVLARLNPDAGLKVEPTWFIEMLNSLSWSDRNQALLALQSLTEHGESGTIEQLRARALPSLVEMARWKTLEHALPAYILVGRIAGWNETQIRDAWSRGNREQAIAAALKRKK